MAKINNHTNVSIRADTIAEINKGNPLWKKFYRFDKRDINKEGRTIDISFASEQPYTRWFGPEILECDAASCDLSRFNEGLGCVLFNHNADYVIGHIEKAYYDDTQHTCRAVITFDTDEASELIYQKILSGTLQGISVGYMVYKYTELYDDTQVSANGRFTGPAYIAVQWTPMEISVVSVPADDSVGIGRSMENMTLFGKDEAYRSILENLIKELSQKSGGQKMNYEGMSIEELLTAMRTEADEQQRSAIAEAIKVKLAAAPTKPAQTVNTDPKTEPKTATEDDVKRAQELEKTRTMGIITLCHRFNQEPDAFIEENKSLDEVRAAILDTLAKDHKPVDQGIQVGMEEIDKFKAAATDAIMMRAGVKVKDKPAAGANELRYLKLMDFAKESLLRSGQKIDTYEPFTLVRSAITGTDAFPNILADVAHKVMSVSYNEQAVTYPFFTRKGSNTDFKPSTRVELSDADQLLPIPEHGIYKHAEVKDSGLTVKLGTFGRTFSLTRQAIINDDLNALSELPRLFGLAARRGINEDVYDLINSNAKAPDGKVLFSADHGNLISQGAAISVASLGAMKALMMRQKRGKVVLNIIPQFLIVPPELDVIANQLIASTVDPSKGNTTINPFANKLTVVTDGYLTDTKAWYLFGDPVSCNTIEVTYLNGVEDPYLESRQGFDVDGMEFKIRHDYAASILDYKAMFKNVGA